MTTEEEHIQSFYEREDIKPIHDAITRLSRMSFMRLEKFLTICGFKFEDSSDFAFGCFVPYKEINKPFNEDKYPIKGVTIANEEDFIKYLGVNVYVPIISEGVPCEVYNNEREFGGEWFTLVEIQENGSLKKTVTNDSKKKAGVINLNHVPAITRYVYVLTNLKLMREMSLNGKVESLPFTWTIRFDRKLREHMGYDKKEWDRLMENKRQYYNSEAFRQKEYRAELDRVQLELSKLGLDDHNKERIKSWEQPACEELNEIFATADRNYRQELNMYYCRNGINRRINEDNINHYYNWAEQAEESKSPLSGNLRPLWYGVKI